MDQGNQNKISFNNNLPSNSFKIDKLLKSSLNRKSNGILAYYE